MQADGKVPKKFNNLEKKKQLSFLAFHIVDFYPSITDNLLIKTIRLAQKYLNITDTEFEEHFCTTTKETLGLIETQ